MQELGRVQEHFTSSKGSGIVVDTQLQQTCNQFVLQQNWNFLSLSNLSNCVTWRYAPFFSTLMCCHFLSHPLAGPQLYLLRFHASPRLQSQPLLCWSGHWKKLSRAPWLAHRRVQTSRRFLPCCQQLWVLLLTICSISVLQKHLASIVFQTVIKPHLCHSVFRALSGHHSGKSPTLCIAQQLLIAYTLSQFSLW